MNDDTPEQLQPGVHRYAFRGEDVEAARQARAQFMEEVNRHAEERRLEKQEKDFREDRLAAIAEAGHAREEKADGRNRLMLWIAIAGLVFAVIAAVTGIIAVT